MSTFLPQNDPHSLIRWGLLKGSRHFYQYNYSHVSPLAMAEDVPITDEPSFRWFEAVGERAITVLANHFELEGDSAAAEHHRSKRDLLKRLLNDGKEAVRGIRHIVEDALMFHQRIGAAPKRPESLDEYGEIFRAIGLPPIHKDFKDDFVFAWMRIAGPNSVMIHRISGLPDHFPVTDSIFESVQPTDTLEAAAQEGRLYLADYKAVEHVEDGTFPHGQKYLYAPLALFVVEKTTNNLMPVAIQVKQDPAKDNPIFTPHDGYNWLIAKTTVEIADANIHEAVTHLARTHLFMEPFVVSTHRQLSSRHPLNKLLMPHFEGTLNINELAYKFLIANRGGVDKLAGGTIQATRKLSVRGVQDYLFNEQFLPRALHARGVDDTDVLPTYPYRDDAMQYWNAIRSWASDYTNIYYKDQTDLNEDVELSAWLSELASENGGRINGIRNKGIITHDYLTDALTMVIYTCSVQHAAVNFPQYDLMSYVPNMPLAGYAPAPTSKEEASEQDFLDQLPPMDMAELQMELGYMLGTVHYTQLGQYEDDLFEDAVNEPLKQFQSNLEEIGKNIDAANEKRRPYTFLDPKGVPQSINI